MRILADAGYVAPRNTGRGPGSRTWYRLTRDGRQAFDAYRETLRGLLEHTEVESFEDEPEPPRLESELEPGREPEPEPR
jgi:DNA-binding PadR family transcriptional regulator